VLPGLQELHLYQAKISEGGLAPLADHATLKQLGIYHTPVGDEVLASITKLPLLSFVKLYGTRITKDGVEKFKADTNMSVDFRRGAFLGVAGNDFPVGEGGCRITSVHRGTPAEKAGIQPDDLIVRFGGTEVKNFSGLTELTADREFGEEVELELVRRVADDPGNPVRVVKTKVTLAPWEMDSAVKNMRSK
jgi:S1-C subfamily serine protease